MNHEHIYNSQSNILVEHVEASKHIGGINGGGPFILQRHRYLGYCKKRQLKDVTT